MRGAQTGKRGGTPTNGGAKSGERIKMSDAAISDDGGEPILGGYLGICSDTSVLSNASSLQILGSCKQRPSYHHRDQI